MTTRRQLLAGLATLCAGIGATAGRAHALGRVPITGEIRIEVPFATASLDPHDLFDPLAAIFASAIADPVYAKDATGRVYPTLADGMPTVEDGQTVVRLRPGLRSGRGIALGGRDLAWSAVRARKRGAIALFAEVTPWIKSDPDAPLLARFGEVEPGKLARILASPLCALLPVGFDATAPDGTGAFVASCSPGRMRLERNPFAARGPSFLEAIEVTSAVDLAAGLRSFESGKSDAAWQGLGLHRSRPGARRFSYRDAGWVVLATGRRAGAMGAPGFAQQLANAVPTERLHLGLGARSGLRSGSSWSGAPASLLYDAGSGQLRAIAEAVASKISTSGHEVTATGVSQGRLRAVRATGDFALLVDVVRRLETGPIAPLIALATADRPTLGKSYAEKPPRIDYSQPAHHLTTSLRVGVLGDLPITGGMAANVQLAPSSTGRGVDWGGSYRLPP